MMGIAMTMPVTVHASSIVNMVGYSVIGCLCKQYDKPFIR